MSQIKMKFVFIILLFSILSCNDPKYLIKKAEHYKSKNNINKSIETYNTIIKKYPDTEQALLSIFHLAELYYQLGKYDSASKYYTLYLQKSKNDMDPKVLESKKKIIEIKLLSVEEKIKQKRIVEAKEILFNIKDEDIPEEVKEKVNTKKDEIIMLEKQLIEKIKTADHLVQFKKYDEAIKIYDEILAYDYNTDEINKKRNEVNFLIQQYKSKEIFEDLYKKSIDFNTEIYDIVDKYNKTICSFLIRALRKEDPYGFEGDEFDRRRLEILKEKRYQQATELIQKNLFRMKFNQYIKSNYDFENQMLNIKIFDMDSYSYFRMEFKYSIGYFVSKKDIKIALSIKLNEKTAETVTKELRKNDNEVLVQIIFKVYGYDYYDFGKQFIHNNAELIRAFGMVGLSMIPHDYMFTIDILSVQVRIPFLGTYYFSFLD